MEDPFWAFSISCQAIESPYLLGFLILILMFLKFLIFNFLKNNNNNNNFAKVWLLISFETRHFTKCLEKIMQTYG